MTVNIREGDKYYRFTIIEEIYGVKPRKFQCKCECGNIRIVFLSNLRTGNHKSCGCLGIEQRKKSLLKHGMCGTRFYHIWEGVLKRCNNPNIKNYKYYGGKGIKCEWNSFEEFKDDMYESYLSHEKIHGTKNTTIERENSNGNYSKENCRWATYKEQNSNKKNIIKYKGKLLVEWSNKLGLTPSLIRGRITKNGWTIEEALEIVKRNKINKNYGVKNGMYGKFGKSNPKSKKINQYTLDGDFIKTWDCIKDIERDLGIRNVTICCQGKRNHAGGFIWKYFII